MILEILEVLGDLPFVLLCKLVLSHCFDIWYIWSHRRSVFSQDEHALYRTYFSLSLSRPFAVSSFPLGNHARLMRQTL